MKEVPKIQTLNVDERAYHDFISWLNVNIEKLQKETAKKFYDRTKKEEVLLADVAVGVDEQAIKDELIFVIEELEKQNKGLEYEKE